MIESLNLTNHSPSELTDKELIQSIIGRSQETKCREGSSDGFTLDEGMHALTTCDPMVLSQVLDLSDLEGKQLAAAMELHRRLLMPRTKVPLISPEAVSNYMQPRVIQDYESLWGIFLDAHSNVIGEAVEISRGDLDACDAGPRAFFRNALRRGSCAAIAVHNHPSGSSTPSTADLAITRRLVESGRILETPLRDHVVCTSHGEFTSIRRNNPEVFR